MKKFLLTAALVLALVTSLTAGTMAYYNVKVDELTSDITTKTFSFTYDTSANMFTAPIKLAPGDKAEYLVALKNDSEVNTEATINAALSTYFPGMSLSLELVAADSDSAASSVAIVTNSTADTLAKSSKVAMADDAEDVYKITVEWAYDTNATNGGAYTNDQTDLYAGKADLIELTVNINGKQLADGSASDTHSTTPGVGETVTEDLSGTYR